MMAVGGIFIKRFSYNFVRREAINNFPTIGNTRAEIVPRFLIKTFHFVEICQQRRSRITAGGQVRRPNHFTKYSQLTITSKSNFYFGAFY